MKKLVVLLAVLAVLGGGVVAFFVNMKRVEFVFTGSVREVAVLDQDELVVERFSENRVVWLRRGWYEIRAVSVDYDVVESELVVDGWGEVGVELVFSERRLAELLTSEVVASLEGIFWADFLDLRDDFAVVSRRLFWQGDFYGMVLEQRGVPSDQAMRVRAVMWRVDGEWGVVAAPAFVLTTENHPDVPVGILREVNLLGGFLD